jgi:hypothetical protein
VLIGRPTRGEGGVIMRSELTLVRHNITIAWY